MIIECKFSQESGNIETFICYLYFVNKLIFSIATFFFLMRTIQRRAQNPVKHLRWSFLKKRLKAGTR